MTVLLSGGIDSAVVTALLSNERVPVNTLFVDYGQPAASAERRSSGAIAERFGLDHQSLSIDGLQIPSEGEISGRNDFLVAAAQIACSAGHIALGTHAGTGYADCSPEHAEAWQHLLDVQHYGCKRIITPLMHLQKADVLALAIDLGVPLELTHSCERGRRPAALAGRARTERRSMTPTSRNIRLGGQQFTTPLLIPSVSSRGFPLDSNGLAESSLLVELARDALTEALLVSAYDICHDHLTFGIGVEGGNDTGLVDQLRLLVVDSGGYETGADFESGHVERTDRPARPFVHQDFLDLAGRLPDRPLLVVSYDGPDLERGTYEDQRGEHRTSSDRDRA